MIGIREGEKGLPTTHFNKSQESYSNKINSDKLINDKINRYSSESKVVGNRNNALNTIAFEVGKLLSKSSYSEGVVKAKISELAQIGGLSQNEINSTLESGFKAGIEASLNAAFNTSKEIAYEYKDRFGNYLYELVCIKTEQNKKQFFRRKLPNGEYVFSLQKGWYERKTLDQKCQWNLSENQVWDVLDTTRIWLDTVNRVPYRLPDILSSKVILILEGEKDVETAFSLGFYATTAKSVPKNQLKQAFSYIKDKKFIYIPDCDSAGAKELERVQNEIEDFVDEFSSLNLPRLEHSEDLTDWIEKRNGSKEELENLISKQTNKGKKQLHPIGLGQLLKMSLPKHSIILSPWLREKSLCMIYAWRGIGKTLFSLNLGYAIASGNSFLEWEATIKKRVLYIDGEMPTVSMQERLASIVKRYKKTLLSDEYFKIISADLEEDGIPYLDSKIGQECLEQYIENFDVIIIDNISCLTTQPENESNSWVIMQEWVLKLRRMGKTVILIHHSNKKGGARGTSKREDVLDVVINLKRPKDYDDSQGSIFEIHFEKARFFDPREVSPIEVTLSEDNNILDWKFKKVEDSLLLKIEEFIKMGMLDKEIWEELGISKATFYRYKKKLKNPLD